MSFVSSFVFAAGNTANSMSFTVQLDHLVQTKLTVLATKQNKASSSTVSVSEEEDVNVQFPREPLMANLYDPLPGS
jgi:fructose-1,6-bisphosphatase